MAKALSALPDEARDVEAWLRAMRRFAAGPSEVELAGRGIWCDESGGPQLPAPAVPWAWLNVHDPVLAEALAAADRTSMVPEVVPADGIAAGLSITAGRSR